MGVADVRCSRRERAARYADLVVLEEVFARLLPCHSTHRASGTSSPSQQTVRLGQSCREKQQIVGQETNSYHPPLVADLRCFSTPSARPSTPSRKGPSHCWPGQVSRAGLTSEFGPSALRYG